MIFDRLDRLERYRGLSRELDMAFHFLETEDLTALPLEEKRELDGERVYVTRFAYETVEPGPEDLYEAHERYLDLHVALSGGETVATAPVEGLEMAKQVGEDCWMYRGPGSGVVPLAGGTFVVLYPGEGHLLHLRLPGTQRVDKLVFKIKL